MLALAHKSPRQRGVALITALLIVALTTIMAVSLASRQYMDVRRTGNIMLADQAYLYALALESFATQLLKAYRDNPQQKYDDLEQFQQATMLFQSIPVEGGIVSAQVVFPEAKFNVNTLIDKDGKVRVWQRDYYARLLDNVLPTLGVDASAKDILIDSLLDWIDPDEEARFNGAEDSIYEGRDNPYRAANRLLGSISELYLLEGYSKEILNGIPGDEQNEPIPGLFNYLTALPDRDSKLNINFIEEPLILMALSSQLTDEDALQLLESRPFDTTNKFTAHRVFQDMQPVRRGEAGNNAKTSENSAQAQRQALENNITVQSNYFLLKGEAMVGESKIPLNSLLYVNTSGTKLEVIYRAIGTNGI